MIFGARDIRECVRSINHKELSHLFLEIFTELIVHFKLLLELLELVILELAGIDLFFRWKYRW
jgi:hypothetical protein